MATHGTVRLSVVVPCYRAEAYLPRCLDSLLAQTLEGIEVICVNDGSPDGTLALLRAYEAANPGVVRVVDKENEGIWSARWSGTDVARGAYVTYVDSDDYVEPSFARDLYETAVREGAEISVCGFRRVDEATGRTLSTEMAERHPSFDPADDPGRLIEINTAVWNKCFSRDLLGRMPRLASKPAALEDVSLCELAYLSARGRVAFTGTAPYNYLVHEGSAINSVTVEQVESAKPALLEVRGHYESGGASAELLASLDAVAFLHLGISMSFRLSCNPRVDLAGELRRTTAYLDGHFPTWRRSPYIGVRYALSHGATYQRLLAAQLFYRAHLMRPFLAAYRFYLAHSGRDLKW